VVKASPEERAYWLAWSQIDGVGPVSLQRLQVQLGSLAQAWQASPSDLLGVDGFGLLTVEAIAAARRHLDPAELLAHHERENRSFWTPADDDYPRLLRELPDPPPVLYYEGNVESAELQGITPLVAIVGTRSPSDYGRRWTRRLTATLIQQGFTIVSGLADGIDTETHRCCMELGGRTIAVLGTGVNVVYPWSNRHLQPQIAQHGLLLSEYPANTQPDRVHFPRRNRIIAGMSRATIVIEARRKSGALITAHQANEYGRDVYVLPGSLDNPRAIGCLELVNTGAQAILSEEHLLGLLGTLPALVATPVPLSSSPSSPPLPPNLPPEQLQILDCLSEAMRVGKLVDVPFDLIVQQTQLPAGLASSALMQLELAGLISESPGMRYRRTRG
jgi:DNA processing protein